MRWIICALAFVGGCGATSHAEPLVVNPDVHAFECTSTQELAIYDCSRDGATTPIMFDDCVLVWTHDIPYTPAGCSFSNGPGACAFRMERSRQDGALYADTCFDRVRIDVDDDSHASMREGGGHGLAWRCERVPPDRVRDVHRWLAGAAHNVVDRFASAEEWDEMQRDLMASTVDAGR